MLKSKIVKAVIAFDILKNEFEKFLDVSFDIDLILHLPEKVRNDILQKIKRINTLFVLYSSANEDNQKLIEEELAEILEYLEDLNEMYYGLI